MCGCGILLFVVILFFVIWVFLVLAVLLSRSSVFFQYSDFFFFFWIFECKSPFKPNNYFCYLGCCCCCSCLINILGGERFGCLTNSDAVESFVLEGNDPNHYFKVSVNSIFLSLSHTVPSNY